MSRGSPTAPSLTPETRPVVFWALPLSPFTFRRRGKAIRPNELPSSSHRLSRRYDNGLQHRADAGIAQQLSIPVKSEVVRTPFIPVGDGLSTALSSRGFPNAKASGDSVRRARCASRWRNRQRGRTAGKCPRMGGFPVTTRCPNVDPFGGGLCLAFTSNVTLGVDVFLPIRSRSGIGSGSVAGKVFRWCA